MKNNKGEILVGSAIVFKETGGKILFMLNKNNDGDFEILKIGSYEGRIFC